MNSIFSRNSVFWLLSLPSLLILSSGLSAVAQTADTTSSMQLTQDKATSVVSPLQPAVIPDLAQYQQPFPSAAIPEAANAIVTPVPGTIATSSAALTPEYQQPISESSTGTVAQADINPGRPTRGGRSYVGVGVNIGVGGGDSALSDGNFTVYSKIGLTNTFSVRPTVMLGDNTVILVPVTYDFSFKQVADPFTEPLPFAPYIGAGAAIKTGDNSQVAFLISGGVDVPLNSRFTATAAVNAGFFDKTDIGLLLGVGYNFSSF